MKIILFILLSIPVVLISWRTLFSFKNHGLYRFIAWEFMLWLAVSNFSYWFYKPFSTNQIISWVCLIVSLYYALAGFIVMKRKTKTDAKRDRSLYSFEKTAEIIESGIFKYIRHPLYGSLIFLTWGIFFKHTDIELLRIALLATLFMTITSLVEEQENIAYFGEKYHRYMKKTRMFIPFLL